MHFYSKTTGDEMLKVGMEQAENFGVEINEEDILKINPNKSAFEFIKELIQP